ncbi:MAG: hypothetical protein AAF664_18765 [Planctomycetota bacterium]
MTSDESLARDSHFDIEQRCVGIAFTVGIILMIIGPFEDPMYLIAGAILFASSLITQAIRDRRP